MAEPSAYEYPSPLKGWENLPPLPKVFAEQNLARDESDDAYVNLQTGILSPSYCKFSDGVTNGPRGGCDVHIYFPRVRIPRFSIHLPVWLIL